MRRGTAVLSTLELTADRARWFADHVCGHQTRTTRTGEGGLPNCHTPRVSMGHSQTGSCRSPESAYKITAPVVLALHGTWCTAQSETVRNLPGQQARPSPWWSGTAEAKYRRALAGRSCRPGQKRVHGTTRRCGKLRKATSILGSALTAPSSRAHPPIQKCKISPREGLHPEIPRKSHPQRTKRT